MLWLMAKYANGVAKQKGLGIRFQAIVPQQIIGGTGVGDNASRVYAQAAGLDREAFLARFGAPLGSTTSAPPTRTCRSTSSATCRRRRRMGCGDSQFKNNHLRAMTSKERLLWADTNPTLAQRKVWFPVETCRSRIVVISPVRDKAECRLNGHIVSLGPAAGSAAPNARAIRKS